MFVYIKKKTACEMRISDWSSDVCSSELVSALTSGVRRSRGSHLRCNPAPHSLAQRFRRFNEILWCRAASLPDVARSPRQQHRVVEVEQHGGMIAAAALLGDRLVGEGATGDRKSTRLNSSH